MCLAAVVFCCSLNLFAHEQKAAITSVVFSERSNNIEVVHRFNLHDAEHAVKRLFGKDADIYLSNDTQTKFADYVYEKFTLASAAGENIELTSVGFEREGKFFWVYQEAPIPNRTEGFIVQHSALQEIWPSQVNTVNLESGGRIQTLTFNQQIQTQSVNLSVK